MAFNGEASLGSKKNQFTKLNKNFKVIKNIYILKKRDKETWRIYTKSNRFIVLEIEYSENWTPGTKVNTIL